MYKRLFLFNSAVVIRLLIAITISSFITVSCEKESGVEFKVYLKDSEGNNIKKFHPDEYVRFDFYLINKNDYSIRYTEPSCKPFEDFLSVYQKSLDSLGNIQYTYIGKPRIICPTVSSGRFTIEADERKFIGFIPINDYITWPELVPSEYYVGDEFVIKIEDEYTVFKNILYFEVY